MWPNCRQSIGLGLSLVFALILLGLPGMGRAQGLADDSREEMSVPLIESPPSVSQVLTDADNEAACPPPVAVAPFNSPGVVRGAAFPFVPFMLGDYTGPLANPMTDIKASEGESPIPLDRVFYRFNFYSGLDPTRYDNVSNPYKRVNLFTNVFGFEKTFGDRFSFGLRIPINGIQAVSRGTYYVASPIPGRPPVPRPAVPDYNSTQFGNMTALFKMRLVEDLAAGYLISGGLSLSFPTATTVRIDPGPSIAAIFQPFVGGVLVRDRFFVQGFSSITLPMVSVQSMLLFNDLGLGVWAYRDENPASFLTGIAPTFEMHLNVPLQGSNRVADIYNRLGVLPFNTQFNMTFGATVEFFQRATLGLGFVVPTVSPLPFDYEFLAHLNVRF